MKNSDPKDQTFQDHAMLSLHAEDYQQEDYDQDNDAYYDTYVYKEDISDKIDNTIEELDNKIDKQ